VSPDWHVLLRAVVGSKAYGLDHAGSDTDYLSLAAAPTTAFHGLRPPTGKMATRVTQGTGLVQDEVTHEVGKAVTLMLGCNPTLLELLYLPLDCYEVSTPLAAELVRNRDAFSSRQAVRNVFLGYATQQFRKLQAHGTFGADTRRRTDKHSRHLMRLCRQGLQLYATGTMEVRVPDPEAFFAFGNLMALGDDYEPARRLIASTEEAFDRTTSPLPDRPDEARVEAWLRWVRHERWRAEEDDDCPRPDQRAAREVQRRLRRGPRRAARRHLA